ncbi:hypothetical protein GTR02_21540 [Kineococcus sp. R8]|uniref:hypothetical protein n=1 Tax=Kineococcus siccus TaxID=2696567 RepID=UPI001411D82D|nr:hypothetical protein [Kineococcus siccus]NAZ84388.1 hypothetical protein [Kineococcus siccus]
MTGPSDDRSWRAPLTRLPLPPEAVSVLESLLPLRGRSRRGYNRPPDTLAETWQPSSRSLFVDWLGCEPAALPHLVDDYGLVEHFVMHPFEQLPPRRGISPGSAVALNVLYVPADLDWSAPGSYAAAAQQGMVTVSMLTGYGAPWPQVSRPTWQVSDNEGSGDSVVVPMETTLVGVQRRQARSTRLAWPAPSPAPGFNLMVWANLPPVQAVTVLVKDWTAMRLRPLPHPH